MKRRVDEPVDGREVAWLTVDAVERSLSVGSGGKKIGVKTVW